MKWPLLFCVIVFVQPTFAEQAAPEAGKTSDFEEFATRISGITEPESIPYNVRNDVLVSMFGETGDSPGDQTLQEKVQKGLGLEADDAAKVAGFFAAERSFQKSMRSDGSSTSFCKRHALDRDIDEIDFAALGRELNENQREVERRAKDRFDKLWNELSGSGRATLD